jgi:hypothetical protein
MKSPSCRSCSFAGPGPIIRMVTGPVVRLDNSRSGTYFLSLCEFSYRWKPPISHPGVRLSRSTRLVPLWRYARRPGSFKALFRLEPYMSASLKKWQRPSSNEKFRRSGNKLVPSPVSWARRRCIPAHRIWQTGGVGVSITGPWKWQLAATLQVGRDLETPCEIAGRRARSKERRWMIAARIQLAAHAVAPPGATGRLKGLFLVSSESKHHSRSGAAHDQAHPFR